MKISKIDFYYFTGTGNTLLVVNEMTKFFRKNNVEVNLKKIEKTNLSEFDTNATIGLAFPVAMQSTYPFVWDFLKSLPETDSNTEVFMVDTLAGFSGGIVGPLKKLLNQKGYKTIGAKEIIMPKNYYFKTYDIEKTQKIQKKGLLEAKRYAHDILFNNCRWKSGFIVSNLLSKISSNQKVWDFSKKHFPMVVDSAKCIKCGLCYKLCPIDNITEDAIPEFKENCQYCMRCISFCPTGAIGIERKAVVQYHACSSNEILK